MNMRKNTVTRRRKRVTVIRNEAELVVAIKEYLAKGLDLPAITREVNSRGVICYAVGIHLLMEKMGLK